ncbi:MAG: aminotransferase DegT, partial [Spirochaetales bacterium]|nr:aminotransferase DegT [Spirochaetales bacterium]
MKKQFNVNQSLSKKIIEAIRISLNFPKKKVYLHEPKFIGNELSYLKECIDTTFVSSIGEFVNRFEKNLKNYTGSKFVVAVVNGTAALHIAMKLVGVCRGDEVLLPALNFI